MPLYLFEDHFHCFSSCPPPFKNARFFWDTINAQLSSFQRAIKRDPGPKFRPTHLDSWSIFVCNSHPWNYTSPFPELWLTLVERVASSRLGNTWKLWGWVRSAGGGQGLMRGGTYVSLRPQSLLCNVAIFLLWTDLCLLEMLTVGKSPPPIWRLAPLEWPISHKGLPVPKCLGGGMPIISPSPFDWWRDPGERDEFLIICI